MALKRRKNFTFFNVWPGFVDVLSTLLMAMLFALMIFMVSQFYLSDALSNRDQALSTLKNTIEQLNVQLGIETQKVVHAESELSTLRPSVQLLKDEQTKNSQTLIHVEALKVEIAELNAQLQRSNQALGAAQAVDQQQKVEISSLNAKIGEMLASKVKELEQYRSEFFGRLKETLGERKDIRIVGDRFVFQSEVLFSSGSDELGKEGQKKMKQLAKTLLEISKNIPKEVKWVLRIDGHTDVNPIKTVKFKSNWELSTARAISVVKFLMTQGIKPENLVAAGFGEFQPLESENTQAFEKNRRIEMRLDQR